MKTLMLEYQHYKIRNYSVTLAINELITLRIYKGASVKEISGNWVTTNI